MCGQYDWILAKILFSVASLSWTEMQSRFMSLPLPPNQKEKEREQQTCVGNSLLKLCGGYKAVADLREGSGGSGHPSAPLLFRVKKKTYKRKKSRHGPAGQATLQPQGQSLAPPLYGIDRAQMYLRSINFQHRASLRLSRIPWWL